MERAQGSGSLARPSLGLSRWEARESLYPASLPPSPLELSPFGVETITPTSASSKVLTPCCDHGPRGPLLMEGDPEPAKHQREFWVPLGDQFWVLGGTQEPGGLHPASSSLSLLSNPSPRPPESTSRHSGSPSTSSRPPPWLGPHGFPVARAGAPPWPPASPTSLSPVTSDKAVFQKHAWQYHGLA